MSAGNDIANIRFVGQNIRPDDVTMISAGHNISFQTRQGDANSKDGIIVGGPGLTFVKAGNSIDLGSSLGIQAIGSSDNTKLESGENNLIVAVGINNLPKGGGGFA